MGPYLHHKTFDCGVVSRGGLMMMWLYMVVLVEGVSLQLTAAMKMAAFLLQPLLKH